MKLNKWLLGAGAVVVASGLGLMFLDVRSYVSSKQDMASLTPLECVRSEGKVVGFTGAVTESVARRYPNLNRLSSLSFTNVRVVDGDVRFITGGYIENEGGGQFEPWEYGNNQYVGYGSYGSYASLGEALPMDIGVGMARLKGGAHVEIRAQGGQLIKFRGAPLSSTQLFFQGRWERPGDDLALTERMQTILEIAITTLAKCH